VATNTGRASYCMPRQQELAAHEATTTHDNKAHGGAGRRRASKAKTTRAEEAVAGAQPDGRGATSVASTTTPFWHPTARVTCAPSGCRRATVRIFPASGRRHHARSGPAPTKAAPRPSGCAPTTAFSTRVTPSASASPCWLDAGRPRRELDLFPPVVVVVASWAADSCYRTAA
jgi:hypothetical protein